MILLRLPIAKNNILDDLKGIIHKQNDIPYTFSGNNVKGQENKSFMSCLRNLINDLEVKYHGTKERVEIVEKAEASKYGLNIIDGIKVKKEFENDRINFLESMESYEASKIEVSKMYDELKYLSTEYKRRGIKADIDYHEQSNRIAFNVNELSLIITLTRPNNRPSLSVRYSGAFAKFENGKLVLTRGGSPIKDRYEEYTFDRLENLSYSWLDAITKNNLSSSQIVEKCAQWVVTNYQNTGDK